MKEQNRIENSAARQTTRTEVKLSSLRRAVDIAAIFPISTRPHARQLAAFHQFILHFDWRNQMEFVCNWPVLSRSFFHFFGGLLTVVIGLWPRNSL